MKRYAMGFFQGAPAMFEQPDGEYVKWADVQRQALLAGEWDWSKLPRHKFWGAGEPDCPQDLKAPAPPAWHRVAWMHVQGNHFEPSLRQLDDDEKARGWTQFP